MILNTLLKILQVLLQLKNLHLLVRCLLPEALVVNIQRVHLEIRFTLVLHPGGSDRRCLIDNLDFLVRLLGRGELHILLLLKSLSIVALHLFELLLFVIDVVNYSLELVVKAVEILSVFFVYFISSNLLI